MTQSKSMKNCDAVIPLSCINRIPYSYISPAAYLKTNVEGTLNILESTKKFKKVKQVT